MVSYIRTEECRPPKLPRKRKKAAIKAQGRKWYFDTIKLYKIDMAKGTCTERVCKFWDNSSIKHKPVLLRGTPFMISYPTRYW
ncbi:MAG: hypothetical protein IKQ20_03410 [Bacteroidales bacterium]|nr:hypothetical protein [Bacteroidales bacterium]